MSSTFGDPERADVTEPSEFFRLGLLLTPKLARGAKGAEVDGGAVTYPPMVALVTDTAVLEVLPPATTAE